MHLMRRLSSPAPENCIVIGLRSARSEARNEYASHPIVPQPVCHLPAWRHHAAIGHVLPWTSQIAEIDSIERLLIRISEVDDVSAIHFIGAHRHWLGLECKPLLRLEPSSFQPQRRVERRHPRAIEPSLMTSCSLATFRCERPSGMMRPIDDASESETACVQA